MSNTDHPRESLLSGKQFDEIISAKIRMAKVIEDFMYALTESIQGIRQVFCENGEEMLEDDVVYIAQQYFSGKHAIKIDPPWDQEAKDRWISLAKQIFWQMQVINEKDYDFGYKLESVILEGMRLGYTPQQIFDSFHACRYQIAAKIPDTVPCADMQTSLLRTLDNEGLLQMISIYLIPNALAGYVSDQIRFFSAEIYEAPEFLRQDIEGFRQKAKEKVFAKFQGALQYHLSWYLQLLRSQGERVETAEDVFDVIYSRWVATLYSFIPMPSPNALQ